MVMILLVFGFYDPKAFYLFTHELGWIKLALIVREWALQVTIPARLLLRNRAWYSRITRLLCNVGCCLL